MLRAATPLVALALLSCGPKPIIGKGHFIPRTYEPHADEVVELRHGQLSFIIEKISSGALRRDIHIHGTAKNRGDEAAHFDPKEIEVYLPQTDLRFLHVTAERGKHAARGRSFVEQTLEPGQQVYGKLLYKTRKGDAKAHVVEVSWGGDRLVFGHPQVLRAD